MVISIITVTYNSAATLCDTLESVLRQQYKDYEYIVVDGASTDGTIDMLRAYEPRFEGRMRWVSEPDRGLYDAMNKGIAMATGDVVGMLNSDDFYTSDQVLANIAKTFQSACVDAVYGDVHYVSHADLTKSVRYYSSRFFHRQLMRFGYMPAHPSFYCWRILFHAYGKFDLSYKVAADFELLLRFIYVHRIRIRYLHMDFVTMRTGGASTSGLSSHRQILRDHQRALRKHGIYSNVCYEALRYVYKVGEIALHKISKKR